LLAFTADDGERNDDAIAYLKHCLTVATDFNDFTHELVPMMSPFSIPGI
jgi:hypothetical protein